MAAAGERTIFSRGTEQICPALLFYSLAENMSIGLAGIRRSQLKKNARSMQLIRQFAINAPFLHKSRDITTKLT